MDYPESNLSKQQHEALAALIGHPHPGSSEARRLREKPMSMERLIGAPYGTPEAPAIEDVSSVTRSTVLFCLKPWLDDLGVSYGKLADFNRCYRGQILSWGQIVEAITDIGAVLRIERSSTTPKPRDISAKGELVLRDGSDPKNLIKINLNLTAIPWLPKPSEGPSIKHRIAVLAQGNSNINTLVGRVAHFEMAGEPGAALAWILSWEHGRAAVKLLLDAKIMEVFSHRREGSSIGSKRIRFIGGVPDFLRQV
jgi:hypothetical protein